jgi:flagellar basal-body rod protein FlgB
MPDIVGDAAMMAGLGREVTRAVQRQLVAAGNLANRDTPGYRARTLQFADALDDQVSAPLAATNLRAALVVNPCSMRGLQLIAADSPYRIDHPLRAE